LLHKHKEVFVGYDTQVKDKVFITLDLSKNNWETVRDEITDNLLFKLTVPLFKAKDGEDDSVIKIFRSKHKELLSNRNVFFEASSFTDRNIGYKQK